nr:phage tail protein [Burkholderia stagnalis]
MAGNLIQITDAGRAALVAAGNTGSVARRVVEIGIGTAAFPFDKGMTALPNERKRVTTFGGENVAPDTVHVVVQDDSDDQYSLYAFGLYLDNGVLFGVYVQGTPILEKSPAAMLLLASDIVFASIDAAQLQFGPATFLNPPATTAKKGVVELATQAEVDDGADDTRAVTPKTAAGKYAPLVRPQFTGPVKIDGVARVMGKASYELQLQCTDAGTQSGMWRIWGGSGGAFNLHRNTAAAGDFSTLTTPFTIDQQDVARFSMRPTWAGTTPWDTGNFDPNTRIWRTGDVMSGRLTLSGENWQADLAMADRSPGGGSWTHLRARKGGGLDVINSAYNAIPFATDNSGNVFLNGTHILQTNGNLFCQYRGAWLSSILDDLYNRDNSKANAGSTCIPYDFAEFGPIASNGGNGPHHVDAPDTWMVKGVRNAAWVGPSGDAVGALYIRCVRLRNQ